MKHSHKIRSLFLTAILFLGLLPILSVHTEAQDIAAQASHSHPVCDDYCSCGSGHADVSWTAFPSGVTTLSSGHYYLDTAVTGSKTITVTGDVSICLNGKKLTNTTSSHVFYVKGSGTLTICDCVGGGTITNTKVDLSGQSAIGLYNSSSMILYGGTVNGAQFDAIHCDTTGDLQIRGGKITANSDGIYVYELDELTISAGTISATSGSAVSCDYGTFRNITVSGGTLEGKENGIQFQTFTCTGRVQISGGTLNGKGPVPSGTTYAGHYYGLSFMSTNGGACDITISGGTLLGARGGFYNCDPLVKATISGGTLHSSKSPGIFATSGSFQITGGAIYGMTAEGPVTTTMTDGELLYTNLYSASSGSATLRVYGGTVGRIGSNTTSIAISNSLMNPKYPIVVDIYGGTVVGTSYAIRSVSKCSVSLSGGTLSGGTAEIYLGETTASASGAYLSLNGYTGLPVTVEVPSSAAVGTYIARKVPADGLIVLKSNTNSALYDTKNIAVKINGPHTHTYGSWIGEVSATCSKPGTLGHKDCTICYGHFDASGNELTDLTIPIDSNNHVNTSIYPQQDATCTQEGYTAGAYCNSCSTWVLGHEVIAPSHSWVDATCIAPKSCSVCGATEGEPAGHAPIPHEGKASTCTEAGWEDYETCENCDYSTFQALPLAEHTPGEAVEENRKESTCTVKGSYDSVIYCTECPAELNRTTEELPLADHTPGEAVEENRVESTCTVKGSYDSVIYCTQCPAELDRTANALPLAEHTRGETVLENRVESTCAVKGSYDSVVYCAECSEELSRTIEELSLGEHTPGEAVEENRVESACTVKGHYDSVVYCAVCTEELSRTTVALPLGGHTYVEGFCSICGWIEGLEYEIRDGKAFITGFTGPATAFDLPGTIEDCPVTTICQSAFENVSHLTYVGIPENVTAIESSAFQGCNNLEQVSIPTTLKTVEQNAFYINATNMRVDISDLGAWCEIAFTNVDSNPLLEGKGYLYLNGELVRGNIIIPDGTDKIGNYAFWGYPLITGVTIPEGVTTIGDSAFSHCESLQRVHIPDTVQEIGYSAFCQCYALRDVRMGSAIQRIQVSAFFDCGNLVNLSLPDSVTSIEQSAFAQCVKLKEVRIPAGVRNISDQAFLSCNSLQKVTFAGDITSIGEEAFAFCSSLTEIEIPDSVTAIRTGAFTGCTALTSVELPDKLSTIGAYAFQTCYNLTQIRIPDGTFSIGADAFSECYKLQTAVIPSSVAVISSDVFEKGTKLQDIYYEGTAEDWALYGSSAPTAEYIHYGCTEPEGHWHTAGVSATCTKAGSSFDTCPCGFEKNRQELPKLPHTEVVDKAVSATCTTDGKTEGKHCSVCGTVTKAQETVKATGHKEVTDAAVAATCTKDGKTEGKHCSVCGTVTVAQETIKATGHSFQNGKCGICGEKDPDYVEPTEPEVKTVTRVFGADRYATSFKAADTLKAELGVEKFQNVIVASGTGFADALAGSYLAAVKNAPILLVKSANVNAVKDYIKQNLTSGGTVYLLGGVNAVPKTMESGLDGFNVKRLGGADRYETNLLILKEAGIDNKDIIVCTGLNFADSLSASASGLPILLVKGGLTDTQKAFLKGTSGKKIIVGGTSAVSGTVESQLKTYGSVKRLAGATRYDTSVLVAKEFFSAPKAAVLAYAQNFPDGLSGGPLAYALKAPLILTDNNKPTAAVNYATGCGIKSGYVLGGTGLISDKVAQRIYCGTELAQK